jgi:cobalt-zinc-cadmium efflux system membrane fusion protein
MGLFGAPLSRGAVAILAASVGLGLAGCKGGAAPQSEQVAQPTADKVELTDKQLKSIAVGVVELHGFSPERTAVGSIDFNEDRSVQVYSNYPGKIVDAYAAIGDAVTKGQPLYTIESPDLMQASSGLIAAAGVYELTTKALDRDRKLRETKGIADKDFDQAVSDQMAADAALKAARAAVKVFGKSDAEIDQMVARRKVDPLLVVRSPINGRVTTRNAQSGLLVQPGAAPAPYSVADTSTVWMLANVAEADVPLFRRGQPVDVKVMAYPDRNFSGVVSVIGATVDPATHTELVRAEVSDSAGALKPGMFATYVIHTGLAATAAAVPLAAVVRESDGSMNVWVTRDSHHFDRRPVKLGMQQDGFDQIVDGVRPGERVVTQGAVFLSNMANAASAGA